MTISTFRTCREHVNCIVVHDYTTSGSCPVCDTMRESDEGISQLMRNEKKIQHKLDDIKAELKRLNNVTEDKETKDYD